MKHLLCAAGAAVVLFTAAGIALHVTWVPAPSRARADAVLRPATAEPDARNRDNQAMSQTRGRP
jgi:opacity protein-like surface antigen